MKIPLIHKKYKTLSWTENFLSGHFSIGPVTFFGDNAMHWAIVIYTKRFGTISIRPPSLKNKQWISPYIYFSPNGTPWACTFYVGSSKQEKFRAKLRREWFGHNFNTDIYSQELRYVNSFDSYFDYLMACSERKVLIEKHIQYQ